MFVAKVGKHGEFKTEVSVLLGKLVDRPDRGKLRHLSLVVQAKLVGEISIVNCQDQWTPTLRNVNLAIKQVVQGDQGIACVVKCLQVAF